MDEDATRRSPVANVVSAHHGSSQRRSSTRLWCTSIYADDVVRLPMGHDLELIRRVLESFGGASGLCTNFRKCSIS